MAWQRRTLAEVMGQRVIYRNLEPVASDLPGLGQLWSVAGLQECTIPRKTTREYAHVVWLILEEAQRLRGSGQPIERMLMIGDSARNDGAVARNVGLEHATRAFIGLDAPEVPRDCTIQQDVMTANRWDALEDMLLWLQDTGFACDERLAVLVDIDKTIIGARGRNDRIIDLARVRAAESTARSAIGADLDVEAF
ncbi:MAG: hypothetical protein GXY79_02970, partial [Chloroflexi bacterium]|nr:hypothetical protein [Chloroflexota bacterium]